MERSADYYTAETVTVGDTITPSQHNHDTLCVCGDAAGRGGQAIPDMIEWKDAVHQDASPGTSPLSPSSTTVTERIYPKGPADKAGNAADVPNTSYVQPAPAPPLDQDRPPLVSWRPTVMRAGPLSGIFALAIAFGSIVISLGVLRASDGADVSTWSVAPPIYLAILTAVANLSIRYACVNGVLVAWWIRAQKGLTLARLHHDWRSGTTFRGAITAGRHLGILGLATILSAVVFVDGPLLQRSSSVISMSLQDETVPLDITMAQQIPHGFTGAWNTVAESGQPHWNLQFNGTMPAGDGNEVSNDILSLAWGPMDRVGHIYYPNLPIPGMVTGCSEKCRVTIRAPALALSGCTSWQSPKNYNHSTKLLQGYLAARKAMPLDQTVFLIAGILVPNPDQLETINLVTGYGSNTQCKGTLNYTACTLYSAIGEYNFSVVDNLATIESPASPRIVAFANNTMANQTADPSYQGWRLSTLGGIVATWSDAFLSQVVAYKTDDVVEWMSVNTPIFNEYLIGHETCPSVGDPHQDMLAKLNQLMVYTGAIAGQMETFMYLDDRMDPGIASQTNVTVTGYRVGDHNVFHTDYWWFLAAAFVEIICICCVTPTYWGWWKLGRSVSFSPLEIAKAFEAPMLAGCDSYAGRGAARVMGDVRVEYGFTGGVAGSGAKLAFGYSRPIHDAPI